MPFSYSTDSSLWSRLKRLKNEIRVAIVGAGAMGKGLMYQCQVTPGIRCVAIADVKVERATACCEMLKRDYRIVCDGSELSRIVRNGQVAVAEDAMILAQCDLVDVFIESSNSITPAVQYSIAALENHKHLVLMNAEVDLIFGPYLMNLALKQGVAYTSCGGDQHGVIKLIADDLRLWGFDLVMAGNIKGFLDRYSNPEKIVPEADKRHLDYRMAASYTDGTKLCIEMALLANALGLVVTVPGMQGPRARHVRDVFELFDFEALWQNRVACADYILGAEPDGGVFAVGYCDHPYQKSMLSYYKMGKGPFYLFYRPYHLCHIEAMASVVQAILDGGSLLQPHFGFKTNVYAYAKRPLHREEELDGIGGFTCYGLIENCDPHSKPGLPICLADHVTMKRDVPQDEKIFLEDIDYDSNRFDFDLYFGIADHILQEKI
jgi:predicted homoserine dehydrogenase-like protein